MRAVLVDSSVWIAHFRQRNPSLVDLLKSDLVMMHPLILGEIACGTPPNRNRTLADLGRMQQIRQIGFDDLRNFIEREQLYGLGCGLIDLLLLASTLITPGTEIWTLDKRLCTLAERFGVLHQPPQH